MLCLLSETNDNYFQRIGIKISVKKGLQILHKDPITIVWDGVIRNRDALLQINSSVDGSQQDNTSPRHAQQDNTSAKQYFAKTCSAKHAQQDNTSPKHAQQDNTSPKHAQQDMEIIASLFQKHGFYNMLRLIDADFSILFVLKEDIYENESHFFAATDCMNRLQSPTLCIADNAIMHYTPSVVNPTEVLTRGSYRVWKKEYKVGTKWEMDTTQRHYYTPPVAFPTGVYPFDNEDIVPIIQQFASSAVRKCLQNVDDIVYVYAEELLLFPEWAEMIYDTVMNTPGKSIYYLDKDDKKGDMYPIFSIQALGYGEILPFQDRDLYQFLCCLPSTMADIVKQYSYGIKVP